MKILATSAGYTKHSVHIFQATELLTTHILSLLISFKLNSPLNHPIAEPLDEESYKSAYSDNSLP